MFLHGGSCDQDVVDVHEQPREVMRDDVHEVLEHLGRVLEPKWHPQELEQAERSCHHCFWHILRAHRDLMESLH